MAMLNNQMVYGSVKAMKMGMNPELPSVDPHCPHQNIVLKLPLGYIPHFADTPKFNNNEVLTTVLQHTWEDDFILERQK